MSTSSPLPDLELPELASDSPPDVSDDATATTPFECEAPGESQVQAIGEISDQEEQRKIFSRVPFKPRRHRNPQTVAREAWILRELERHHLDINWEQYQFWYDFKFRENPEWGMARIHHWLAQRKYLWSIAKRVVMDGKSFDAANAAYAKLPNDAPRDIEVQWVKTHPRFFRLRQIRLPADYPPDTAITAKDMDTAPSQGAVTMLQEAISDPKGFWAKAHPRPVAAKGPVRPKEEVDEPEEPQEIVDEWDENASDEEIFG